MKTSERCESSNIIRIIRNMMRRLQNVCIFTAFNTCLLSTSLKKMGSPCNQRPLQVGALNM